MAFWKIITLACTASIIVDAQWLHHLKRDAPTNICDRLFNNTNIIVCYCMKDHQEPPTIRSADCFLTNDNVPTDHSDWTSFKTLKSIQKLTFTNSRGIPVTYIPTEALKETTALMKLDIKFGTINKIGSYAFANLSTVEDITLTDNQIIVLEPHAFIHHKDLKVISLDTNNIAEINRNVFVDLPVLEKLFLTNNQISIIHDKAFVNLVTLKELEIDRNKVFSLNFAVFDGLTNLEKLDLSSNNLQVIGDNTFQALGNLKSLNLEGNKIQMLDDKAFYGLSKLHSMSLARNKLVNIDSEKVFEGLKSLVSLSLKGNQLKELKDNVMAPILSNFYGNSSSLDVEDNNFPCDCRLDWFISLMNKTLNKHLKISIENLKCTPDAIVREAWIKTEEVERSTQQVFDEEEPQVQGAEYEYYDESQLNGKMFYVDIRDFLKCTATVLPAASITTTTINTINENATSLTTTTTKSTTTFETSPDILGSSLVDTTTNPNEIIKSEKNKRENNKAENSATFTTTRLATVSAKPVETKIYEHMASDEAKPDKIKAHRSIQEERKDSRRVEKDLHTNNANKNVGCAMFMLLPVLSFRLHF